MPEEVILKLGFDMSVFEEMIAAADYAVQSGELTEEEAAQTLLGFVRIIDET